MINKTSSTGEVIDAVKTRPDIAPYARLVGQWVWVEFEGKPSADTRTFLKESGFRWNQERLAWQHSCGHFARRNRNIDPRMVYGEQYIQAQLA